MDPKSGRSDRRGLTFARLPVEGYDGEVPEFPLMPRRVMRWEYGEKGARWQVVDAEATEFVQQREAELWGWAWRTPQAVAWAREPWRWQAVAHWVRTSVICESDEAMASDRGSLHRFADQIGMTPAGLKENGWAIAADEVATARSEKKTKAPSSAPPERRLRAVPGGGD
ncbi:hypothetical protein NDR87_30885 [Nocardia sp. CDC159]|uniref:Terminase small subunit n=1 Tax=Nocardia pulmonis TaxID=2951408 RepID=A0A9X2J0P1_9NOCA|nr:MULTISPECIES: hypothetical protein [Nocardia]MCM6778044.1 hypothetical protein [Nocardia pulmonis]MCM6790785.1 hypothetical protein [Nocardia sp. CDC159]